MELVGCWLQVRLLARLPPRPTELARAGLPSLHARPPVGPHACLIVRTAARQFVCLPARPAARQSARVSALPPAIRLVALAGAAVQSADGHVRS